MSLRYIFWDEIGNILFALFVSLLSSIISVILASILISFTQSSIPENYMFWVDPFILYVFIFCGAYLGFRLSYSGEIYLQKWYSALMVGALFVILYMTVGLFVPYVQYETHAKHRAFDAALLELNAREEIWWERVIKSGQQFHTDAEIDREIVTGTAGGGWDTDIGEDYIWAVGPTATGGTIFFQYREGMALERTPATLVEPAKWSIRSRASFEMHPRRSVPLLPVAGHYTCTKVESGDTIIFNNNGSEAQIRLLGIDAPEGPCCENEPGQPFSKESAGYLAEMILNKKVKIILYGMEGKDRSKGVVFVENQNVNLEMIKKGLAEVDQNNRFPGFYLQPYLDAEKEARKDGLGMWSLGDCYLSPWDWVMDRHARERALTCK